MNKTAGVIAGFVGGIFGLASSIIVLFMLEAEETTAVLGIVFSLVAIVGASVVRKNGKVGGIILLISGVAAFLTVPLFNIMVAILIIVAGLIGMFQEESSANMH